MNRFSSIAARGAKFVSKVGAVAGTALVPVVAFAQSTDLGTEAASQLTGATTTVKGLLITLVGIVFLFVVYGLIKRAK
jgi:hypothetical protein